MRRAPLLLVAAALAMLVDVVLTMAVAPTAANTPAPLTWRIFYYHVPTAWVAYLAFGVTALASLLHLRRPDARTDAVALASAEIGLVFSAIALVTGLVWARQEFLGYSPVEDPKVISLVVVVFAYAGYLALRASVDDRRRRGRLAAVYGILALVGVPLSYFASRVSIHPDFTRPEQSLDPRLRFYLLLSTLAFTVLYAALLALRVDLARLDARLSDEEES